MAADNRMLNMIEEGMKVYDNNGEEIGTVEFIHFSEANGKELTLAASLPDEHEEADLVGFIRKLFGSDNLPEELRERLLMNGFIRVDSARFFGADRYVMLNQIAKVEKNGVHLRVEDSEGLLKV